VIYSSGGLRSTYLKGDPPHPLDGCLWGRVGHAHWESDRDEVRTKNSPTARVSVVRSSVVVNLR
jgi:hypothetical protein